MEQTLAFRRVISGPTLISSYCLLCLVCCPAHRETLMNMRPSAEATEGERFTAKRERSKIINVILNVIEMESFNLMPHFRYFS